MVKLANIFTDHMVLQRDKKVCIWGKSSGSMVSLEIDNIAVTTEVFDGSFRVYLPAHKAGGPYTLSVSDREERIICQDVFYGEVFVATGQSNMELELQNCENGKQEIQNADYSFIRFYNTPKVGYIDETVEKEIENVSWKSCVKEACSEMSAVAFFAAVRLWEELNVPVGIVDCYQGGTSICCWLPENILCKFEKGLSFIRAYKDTVGDKTDEEYENELKDYQARVKLWDDRVNEIKTKKADASWEEISAHAGDYPWPPPLGKKSLFRPGGCYLTMLCRIAPYTVSSIVYYQGETDADYDSDFYPVLVEYIKEVRRLFCNSKLPFVITQLPMFIEKGAEDSCLWAKVRQAQLSAYESIKNTELLVLADCGEYNNIHPVDKKTPGERLGNLLLETLYGCDTKAKAMLPKEIYCQGDKIVISFVNTYGKIYIDESLGVPGINEQKPEGRLPDYEFEVAGSDGRFFPCEYELQGENIILSGIKNAEYVRYAWWNFGKVRIRNKAGIPLAPFGPRVIFNS